MYLLEFSSFDTTGNLDSEIGEGKSSDGDFLSSDVGSGAFDEDFAGVDDFDDDSETTSEGAIVNEDNSSNFHESSEDLS